VEPVLSLEHRSCSSNAAGIAHSGFRYFFVFITLGFYVLLCFISKRGPSQISFSEPAFFPDKTFRAQKKVRPKCGRTFLGIATD